MEQHSHELAFDQVVERPYIAPSLFEECHQGVLMRDLPERNNNASVEASESLEPYRLAISTEKQPFHDRCIAVLRPFSLSLAQSYAQYIGASIQSRCEILKDYLCQDQTSGFEERCKKLKISPHQFMALIPFDEKLEIFEKLDTHVIFSVSERALLLSDIVTHGGAETSEILSHLESVERLNAEQIVMQIQRVHPLFALQNEAELSKWFSYNREKLIDDFIESDPRGFLEIRDSSLNINAEERARATGLLFTSDPVAVLTEIDQLSLQPEWVTQLVRKLAETEPSRTLSLSGEIAKLSPSLLSEIAQVIENRDPDAMLALTREQPDFCVAQILPSISSASLAQRIAVQLLDQGDHALFVTAMARFDRVPIDNRKQIVQAFERINPEQCYEEIRPLLAWAGETQLSLAPSEVSVRFWRRLTNLREQIGHGDSDTIRNMLLVRAESHPNKVWEHLDELNISLAPWRGEIGLTLARHVPDRCLEIIRKLNIDECAAAEKIVEVYCRKEPAAARAWLKKEAAEFPAHLSSVVDAAERLLKPWHALDRLLVEISPDPQKIIRTAIACAQDNTARAFRELPDKLSAYPNARKRVFESCAEKRLWQTLEAFPSFRLALADIRPTLQRAFVQDPVRSLKASIEFLSQDPQLVRAGLRGAIRSNAAQSLELIRQTNLSVIECVPFLQQALRRNPRLLSEIPQQLVRHLNQDRHAMLIATACKGNIRRAIEILGDRSGCLRSDPELIVRACALENYSMALKTAPSPLKSTLTEPDFLRQLLGQAIVTGRWNSALHVSKLISGIQRDGRTATEEVSITEALLLLDGTLQSLDSRPDLSMEERENVRLMRVIREAHCIPTDNIQAVFDHFGEDDYRYLISVFERGGSSVAEAFFDTLHRVYPFESDISKLDQTIIDECLRHGFRGLSSEMLLRLRPIFEASPVRGKQAIQRYGEVAASILNGQEISAHVIEPSLFPALVHAAYRPVGMTVSAVADLLQTTTDHSAHLKALKYPVMGYPVRLETDAQVTLRNNTTLQQETFESIARILDIESSPSTTLTAPVLFKRMLEGGFDQIDIAAAWRVISSESNDERLPVLSKRILKGTQATAPLRQKLQSLAYARELFSVVARDALLARAEECMGSDASDRFRITPKLEAATRRILKMRADQPIGTDEIMAALDAQVEKLFKSLQYSLAREARKFMQSYEQVGDRYVLYLSKNRASYFGRAGAGLCTAQENWSWNQPTFLQMVMVDSVRGLVVGNIQLHLFKNERDENAVLARLNPTSSFLTVVSPATLAHEMLRTVQTFADENGLIPYLPVQTGWHELTNRDSFAPHLQRYAESQERASVRLTERKTVSHVLRMKQIT